MPKFPVFYCSDVAEISLAESVANKLPVADSVYYVSEWKVMINKKWRAEVFLFGDLPVENPLKKIMDNERSKIIDGFKQQNLSDDEIENYINYFNDEFTKGTSHIFSSMISHSFLYGDEDYTKHGDMILYPSVQIDKIGNNYAFNTKLIDRGAIQLLKVYKLRVHYMTKRASEKYTFKATLESVGEPLDLTFIEWHAPTIDDYKNYNEHIIRLI